MLEELKASVTSPSAGSTSASPSADVHLCMLFSGSVPAAAGLSSSSAMVCAAAMLAAGWLHSVGVQSLEAAEIETCRLLMWIFHADCARYPTARPLLA